MYIEGNKGGDYIQITELPDGTIRLRVGHCCVIVMDHIVPIEWLTSVIDRALTESNDDVAGVLDRSGWSEEFVSSLKEKVSRV